VSRAHQVAIALALSLAVAGCATTKTTKIESVRIETKPKVNVRDPAPIKLERVEWIVITPDNFEAVMTRFEGKRVVFYAVTPEGYKAITLNQAKTLKFMGRQKAVIRVLKDYYDEP
jgi:hypothetical protein